MKASAHAAGTVWVVHILIAIRRRTLSIMLHFLKARYGMLLKEGLALFRFLRALSQRSLKVGGSSLNSTVGGGGRVIPSIGSNEYLRSGSAYILVKNSWASCFETVGALLSVWSLKSFVPKRCGFCLNCCCALWASLAFFFLRTALRSLLCALSNWRHCLCSWSASGVCNLLDFFRAFHLARHSFLRALSFSSPLCFWTKGLLPVGIGRSSLGPHVARKKSLTVLSNWSTKSSIGVFFTYFFVNFLRGPFARVWLISFHFLESLAFG